MTAKAIIFDKDGVLVNSEKFKASSWEKTLAKYDIKDGLSWYLNSLGPTSEELAKIAIRMFKLNKTPEVLSGEWHKNYQAIEGNVTAIKENLQLLARLSQNFQIGIASSMSRNSIIYEMKKYGYFQYISACISGEDMNNNKPAPDIYLEAIRTLQVQPEDCIAIEDSPTGIRSAKRAGIRCIGFQNPDYNLDLSEADLVVSNLEKINFFNF